MRTLIAVERTQAENTGQFPLRDFMVKQLLRFLWHLPRTAAIVLIEFYQQTLSPDHGPLKDMRPYGFCRHDPTCSAYGKKILEECGFVMGTLLTLKRVLGCHPWKSPDTEKVTRLLTREM